MASLTKVGAAQRVPERIEAKSAETKKTPENLFITGGIKGRTEPNYKAKCGLRSVTRNLPDLKEKLRESSYPIHKEKTSQNV